MSRRDEDEFLHEEKTMLLHIDEFAQESNKALAVRDTKGKLIWFPKSQITYNTISRNRKNNIVVSVPAWLAKQHDTLEFEEE